MISFTEKAANKVLNIMQEQKVSEGTVVRVGVKGGGCSGFTLI
jgi:iron-sulfur cluster assembly protein